MHPSLGVGLELPAHPIALDPGAPGTSREDLVRAVRAAGAAGVDMIWFDGTPPRAGAPRAEAVTMAAGASVADGRVGLGVRLTLADGRHPAVVARELTALDLMSGGRAVLALCSGSPGPDDGPGRLAEAVAICHGLFGGGPMGVTGRHYRVAGAVNRPGPRQPGGPPIVVELGPDEPADALEPCLDQVAAWMTGGDEAAVAARRRSLDGLAGGPVTLLWRGPLDGGDTEVGDRARRLVDAGADGVVLVSTGWVVDGADDRRPPDPGPLVRALRPPAAEPAEPGLSEPPR